jgi:hypothetical protein
MKLSKEELAKVLQMLAGLSDFCLFVGYMLRERESEREIDRDREERERERERERKRERACVLLLSVCVARVCCVVYVPMLSFVLACFCHNTLSL